MNPPRKDEKSLPQVAATSAQPKKNYQSPAVKVYGDVRELTGSGPTTGVHDMTLSSPHFS